MALCDLYRGDLLEGIELEEAEFGTWLEIAASQSARRSCERRREPARADGRGCRQSVAQDRGAPADRGRSLQRGRPPRADAAVRGGRRTGARAGHLSRSRSSAAAEISASIPMSQTTELYHSLLPSPRRASAKTRNEPQARARCRPSSLRSRFDRASATRIATAVRPGRELPRITILPPAASGGQDYRQQLASSLIEDVTIGLCRFKALSVIAPHTAWELSQDGNRKALLRTFKIDYCGRDAASEPRRRPSA